MPQHYGGSMTQAKKRKEAKPKTPRGMHRMPDGSLMKGEKHQSKPKTPNLGQRKPKPFDLKEGALSKQLGIAEKDKIPKMLLRKIDKAKVGDMVKLPSGKEIKVTPLLHKRVRFVLNIALK